MKQKRSRILCCTTSFVVLLSLLSAAAGILTLQKQTSAAAHNTYARHNFLMTMTQPSYWIAGNVTDGMHLACQAATAQQRCYSPQQIQKAYNANPLYRRGISGTGSSIVIIDMFQSPTIRHDLHMFDKVFGLPDPSLHIYAPDGLVPFDQKDQTQVAWAAEITLDVEWAHAIAPDAAINLVLANPLRDNAQTFSAFLLDMLRATRFAIANNLGDVISQSFGGNEACASFDALQAQHAVFAEAAAQNITLIASSGDEGAAQDTCDYTTIARGVSTPASDPLVTAVGGTTLAASTKGSYIGESSWNGSGGGFSTVYARPAYQGDVVAPDGGRGIPDVSYDGDPYSGVLVIWSSSGLGANLVAVFGGTSAGAPQWAGITALLDQSIQGRFGFLNNALYAIDQSNQFTHVFHDIVKGNNTFVGQNAKGANVDVPGFRAARGWDPVTGLGTPNITHLVELLPQ